MSFSVAKRIVERSLVGAGLPAPFVDVVSTPLRQRGRILSDIDATRWYGLINACCTATAGNQLAVPSVVASVEIMIAALDVLDEIEDGDQSALLDLVGRARAINATTTLLGLAHVVLNDELLTEWNLDIVGKLHETLAHGIVHASIGQDSDLQTGDGRSRSVEEAFRIAQMKSGSLAATACRMGALLGTTDLSPLAVFDEFGLHFGTMAQIANDIHDAVERSGKTDLELHRATLPNAFSRGARREVTGDRESGQELAAGALQFAWVVFEAERLKCLRNTARLAELGYDSQDLASLVGG